MARVPSSQLTVTTSIRLDEDTYERLRQLALLERRSISQQIRKMIEEGLEKAA